MANITIKTVKLSAIKLNPDNPRRISEKDMDRLVKSLQDFPEMMQLRVCFIDKAADYKKVSGIYAIFNSIDERVYIGSAVSVARRIWLHKTDLNANRHHSQHLQNFYNKYGEGSIGFAFLCETEKTKDCLIGTEQRFLDYLKPAFNISPTAGSVMGTKKTPEQRKALSEKRLSMNIRYDDDYKKRMSIALSGKNNPMYGKSPNWGKKHKPETIQKMKESHRDVKGKNNPKYGIPQSPEASAKARITRRKRVFESGRGVKAFKDGDLVGVFQSATEASEKLGITLSSIYRVCNGKWKQTNGFQFSYTGGDDAISQTIRA